VLGSVFATYGHIFNLRNGNGSKNTTPCWIGSVFATVRRIPNSINTPSSVFTTFCFSGSVFATFRRIFYIRNSGSSVFATTKTEQKGYAVTIEACPACPLELLSQLENVFGMYADCLG
jgi:hypothetical protein